MPLAASGVTHQGRRSTNEDTWLVDLDLGLLLVADGVVAPHAGEVVSALAVEVIREFVVSHGAPPTAALLKRALEAANERILNDAGRQVDHAGMGTTVVAVLIDDA